LWAWWIGVVFWVVGTRGNESEQDTFGWNNTQSSRLGKYSFAFV
jgi:hypothetical protein